MDVPPRDLPSPQGMDVTTLRAVVSDLRSCLLPSRFEKAQQPDPHSLQLGFRTLTGMVWLELSWQADLPRLVLIPPPQRQGGGSTLAQQIQHSLRQLALVQIEQQGFERVVTFALATRPGDPIQRRLVLELMGRHSNLMLLDPDQRIIAIGRQVRDHQSRVRPISTGDTYLDPPGLQGQIPSLEESFERWRQRLTLLPIPLGKALRQTYQGISPSLSLQLAHEERSPAEHLLSTPVEALHTPDWLALHARWQLWLQQLQAGSFRLRFDGPTPYRVWGPDVDSEAPAADCLSLSLGLHYRHHNNQRRIERQARELRHSLEHWRQREQRHLEDQERRLHDTDQAQALQQEADGLLCHASPSREQIDRAQKLYQRARKLRRAEPLLEERRRYHLQRLQLIEGSEAFLDNLLDAPAAAAGDDLDDTPERLQELRGELNELLMPHRRRNRADERRQRQEGPQPLQLRSPNGLLIQVGRNHRQNDWISLRQARPGDLWFHAQECPGSHVVLKASSGLASEEDLVLAADLAAHFSRARRNRKVAVVMVPVEQLQRIAGAAPGTVRHRGGDVRWAEPERIAQQLLSGGLLA